MSDNFLTRLGNLIGKRSAIPSQTLGSSKTSAGDYGYIVERSDTALNLVGARRYEVYQEMVRDVSIVAAGVRLFINLIANAVWTVNPPEDLNDNENAVAQEYADQAYAILFDMTSSWSTVIRKIAMFRFQGFAVMEWTAKRRDDGTIGLLDIEHRPQQTIARWLRDAGGTVEAVVQRIPGGGEVTIPRGKLVYAVDDTFSDSPEGVGLFRHLAAVTQRLELFEDLEEIGFANDLRGIPVARAPLAELRNEVLATPEGTEARDAAEATRLRKLDPMNQFLENHVRNEEQGVLLPSDVYVSQSADNTKTPSGTYKWGLELLSGDSTSFEPMAEAIKRMTADLARIMGVEHLLLGQDGGGSLALARSKIGTFYLTVSATLSVIAEVLDRDVLKPLAELNGWPDELRPRMGVNEIADRDIEQVTQALANIANAGVSMMPGDPAVGELYDDLGLTRPPDESVAMALDAALRGNRNKPVDPAAPLDDPKPPVEKSRRIVRGLVKRRRR